MLKKITSNKIFWIFVLTHLLLFNINYAEWGDSYRILRASEFIRQGQYPGDEKRQPLYSVLLAVRPERADQIFWGRVEMFIISLAAFCLFEKLLDTYRLKKKQKDLALLLFTFNPVFLYWSLRIMADVPFTALVILLFYLYRKWQPELDYSRMVILGVVVGLASLMRFEGFILGVSLALGVILENIDRRDIKISIGTKFYKVLTLLVSFLLMFSPWLLYRNPLESGYFEEPSGRAYDLKMVMIYISSLLYLFGFTSAFFFIFSRCKEYKKFFQKNLPVGIFILLELVLALVWPAAIPRLFTPIIPLMVIPLAVLIHKYFIEDGIIPLNKALVLPGLFVYYVVVQYFLRLQFLILIKPLLYLSILMQLVNLTFIYYKKYTWFLVTLVISLIVWSYSSILLHKDIFRAVVDANLYISENLYGRIAYNDVSNISDWYLNQRQPDNKLTGIYLNMDARPGRSYQVLAQENVDYIMITNEHNPTLEFSAHEVDYLEEIKEFRYTIRGTEFFTKIIEFKK